MNQRLKGQYSKLNNSEALDLNLRTLDIFVQIAESGGMSSTARRMGLTQSAVSQVIANLEQSLGVQLFDRHVRPIALTPCGVVLLDRARALLASARDAIHAVRQPMSAALPRLNLCLVDSIAGTIGPDLVAALQGLAAQWTVHAGLSGPHGQALLAREADIIITPDAMEDQNGLERHEILKEPFIVALPVRYTGPAESLAAIARSLDLIRFSQRSLIGKQIERHLRRMRLNAPGKVEFDGSDAVLAMVAGGLGWAIITPLCAVQAQAHFGGLRLIPIPDPGFSRRVFVVSRAGEYGDIPHKVADFAAGALSCLFEAKFARRFPAIAPAITVAQATHVPRPSECIACQAETGGARAVMPALEGG
jgi:DNA-binding transcriptional LysR family regulator